MPIVSRKDDFTFLGARDTQPAQNDYIHKGLTICRSSAMNLLIDMDTKQRWGLQQALAGDSTLRINF